MWVFIRPRGGQKCYLLAFEIRRCAKLCPIHRFDRMDQIPFHRFGICENRACKLHLECARVKDRAIAACLEFRAQCLTAPIQSFEKQI